MSELRLDVTSGEWVVVAPERGFRPNVFRRGEGPVRPASVENCPFCPGHEHMTPPELERLRLPTDGEAWQVRIVTNRYPAFSPQGPLRELAAPPPLQGWNGTGAHEVVIETPRHDQGFADLPAEEAALVYRALQRRQRALAGTPGTRAVVPFKNHGSAGGASLDHSHSQIVATPLVPGRLLRKVKAARAYRREHGQCLYARLVEVEREQGQRLLFAGEGLVAFHPYASRWPFEAWVVPEGPVPDFDALEEPALSTLAAAVQRVLRMTARALGEFSYNVLFHLPPVGETAATAFPWHLQIVPRLITWAGFELITGMYINQVAPEQTAEHLRALEREGDGNDATP